MTHTRTNTLIILLFIISRATTFSENLPSSRIFSVCGHQILCMRRFNAIDYVTRSDFVVIVCMAVIMRMLVSPPFFNCVLLTLNNDDPQFSGNTKLSCLPLLSVSMPHWNNNANLWSTVFTAWICTCTKRQPHSPWWQSQWYYGFFSVYFHYFPSSPPLSTKPKTKRIPWMATLGGFLWMNEWWANSTLSIFWLHLFD